ncbi:MAG: ABC transporter permease [Oscillospiraceae bacterium]|jgi:ABC-2 type transport system permease protein|nr:ABC transporter permease [Oscillospiraceae bacterium]
MSAYNRVWYNFVLCVKILRSRWVLPVVFAVIYTALSVILSLAGSESTVAPDVSAIRYTVVNRSQKDLPQINGLLRLLKNSASEVTLADTSYALDDAVFYQATDYILIISEDFDQTGKLLTQSYGVSSKAYYIDRMINGYLSAYDAYVGAGFTPAAAAQNAAKEFETAAAQNIARVEGTGDFNAALLFFQLQSYAMLMMIPFIAGSFLIVFKRREIVSRLAAAPLRPVGKSISQGICVAFLSVVSFLMFSLINLFINSKAIAAFEGGQLALLLLNSLCVTVLSAGLGQFAGMVSKTNNIHSAIVNIVSLVFAFLGGIFIPASLFGEGLHRIARLLPLYWYSHAIESIAQKSANFGGILPDLAVQLGYALLFFAAAGVAGTVMGRRGTASGVTAKEE